MLIIVHLPTQTDIYSPLKSVNVIKFKKRGGRGRGRTREKRWPHG